MGASGSKIEEDEALNLCRERKKFVRGALDGRCSLAAAHVAYIHCLKSTGTALRRFVLPMDPIESSLYTSTSDTPDQPHSFSFSSAEQLSSPPSPPTSSRFHVNHMSSKGSFAKNVEETPQNVTLQSHDDDDDDDGTAPYSTSPPWDYFGLSKSTDNHLPSCDQIEMSDGFENDDDEFDDTSSEDLVRSFENLVKRGKAYVPSPPSVTPENEILSEEIMDSPKVSPMKLTNEADTQNDAKMAPDLEDDVEHKVAPKDFFLSMMDVECLFGKASDCGREVPRMLEANKLHFRPINHGCEKGSRISMLLKGFFSCREDQSQVPEDPAQSPTKYLTWHQTASSQSSSSRILLGENSSDAIDDLGSDLLERSCMISGSHASTLDRLYAWERKLYDEVKASQTVRRQYDMKCKVLREQESSAASSNKIDKTRAVIKALHSRIGVAIHRIHSVSEKIEELRDNELQPQLEELIQGLSRMWESMFDYHKLQLYTMSIANTNINSTFSVHSALHRHFTLVLNNELSALSSSFTKCVSAQNSYVQAIDSWLHKCVALPQSKSSWRKRRGAAPPPLRNYGPPIYTVSGVWVEKMKSLPVKEVVDTVKGLADETSRFLPPQGKKTTEVDVIVLDDWNERYDHFKTCLVMFLRELSSFAEDSMKMYHDLHKSIQEAKTNYEHLMSQP